MTVSRKSLLERWHEGNGAVWEDHDDARWVGAYRSGLDEPAAARQLAVCDLSLLARTGFKGRGAPDWLARHISLPEQANLATGQADNSLVARLSRDEHLLIAAPHGDARLVTSLNNRYRDEQPPGVYPLPRADSHCLFALSGHRAAESLAKLCAVDMRPERFPCGAVAQTSVAKLNAIVIRTFALDAPVYYLLAEATSAEYLWDCLMDAMSEYPGRAIGCSALRTLLANRS